MGVTMVKNADIVMIQRKLDLVAAQTAEVLRILKRLEASIGVEGISGNLGQISLKGGYDAGAEGGTASLKRNFDEISDDRRPGGSSHKRRKDAGDDV
jgi:hypothetical protein